ncbi:hypothetical protein ACFV6E_28095 [Streptomyces sp. NPDC059785]|uniref:F0F1 ATP synthase subunit B family protein n=1 Tax=Streptomyces sp. NPDC059785 TaxID=3346945 RepID=UPI00365617AE
MYLLPLPLGPLNPRVQDILCALLLFAICFLLVSRLLRRINRVLHARAAATDGTAAEAAALRARAEHERARAELLLAGARHEAARLRQRAVEEGAALLDAARADGRRARDEALAEGQARIESERAAAEAELRMTVSELASALATRVVGEPVSASGPPHHG